MGLKNDVQIDAIYLDYRTAFDSVNHKRLLSKLHNFGIRGSLLLWLTSYLNDRTCQVRIKNAISSSFSITSGVPQGSHIGPILFMLILSALINCKFLLYADDIKFFTKITTGNDAE